MFSRAQIKYEVYQRLNKDASTRGFYSDAKCESAITESVDFVATEMLLADEGWLKKIDFIDTVANQTTIELPRHMSMISELRYLVGNVYIPLVYDSNFAQPEWSLASGAIQFPSRYKIVDNRIYFNPPLGEGGSQYLQVDYMSMPKIMRTDTDKLEPQFDRYAIWFIVYNSMSIMAESMRQVSKPWEQRGMTWYERMKLLLNTRNMQTTTIEDFSGY